MMRLKLTNTIFLAILLALPLVSRSQINTEQVLRVGQNAMYFEDYVLSIQYFNQVIQAKPYLATPYLMRSIAKLNLDDYTGAEADASKAIELNEFLTDAWEVRGVARQNLGRNSQAVDDYTAALKLLPRNRQIMFNRSLALHDLKKYDEADSAFAELLKYYPNFENGYIGRAKLRLEKADTIGAQADIEKALSINPNALNAYLIRASIAIDKHNNYEQALADMNQAIKLEPRLVGLYINRAFLRYSTDDYFGAMADYDYALDLEPLNKTALFNRSLLLMEVSDNDRALKDLDMILQLDPEDYRARYNRAIVRGFKREYAEAIADIQMVINRFPDFSGAYYMLSEFEREQGHLQKAKGNYDKAWALAKTAENKEKETDSTPEELTPEAASRKFNTLLTIDNETHIQEEYNNQAIRGRVQDRDMAIEIEPLMEISYYSSPTELRQDTYYFKEVDDINNSRMLRYVMKVVPDPPALNDPDLIQRHFSSVEYFDSYLATHQPRTIDYLGRAMDLITLKNYTSAIADLDRAAVLSPDHAVAYFLRGQARVHAAQTQEQKPGMPSVPGQAADNKRIALNQALDDFNKVIELSPRTAVAWFNKGNVLYELGDMTSAIASYTRAIELQAAMGEAYYNRGYIHLKLGNQKAGIDDLSKAGELGIVSAYNLIKRISKTL